MKISLLSNLVLALTVPSVFSVTLYRNGNGSNPYDEVDTPQDYDNPVNGVVPANPNKGVRISTSCPFIHIIVKLYSGF